MKVIPLPGPVVPAPPIVPPWLDCPKWNVPHDHPHMPNVPRIMKEK